MSQSGNLIGEMIAASAKLAMGYADRLLTGVGPDDFARFAAVGDTTVQANHPCFILGHLSLYPCRVVSQLGGDAASIEPTDAFVTCFNKDAACRDDVDGTIYPNMDAVVDAFRRSHQLAIETVRLATDDQFDAPNPNEAMREKFPTIAAMHGFYLGGHLMIHMGQFSTWRRIKGMGAA
ncbi:DinB family protein [Roseiconus lacunae]|uniref:DinB family protein n=1 Tax=Roseiconus lacunae TaxID=2605694 RepID=A0ABT7PCE0_9BACT|nr:DinB family protein [Roseiconus lacunae]MDM4014152.1 DinB family protein [Roseiconus lacunae]WRQ53449.1 DinB family protein [Stieleria sp. HD01]